MNELYKQYNARLLEVDTYLDLLLSIEMGIQSGAPRLEGIDKAISAQQQRILYSTVYLQLYNLVESTMTSCIKAIIDAASKDGCWKPSDLSEPLKKEWVRFKAQTNNDNMNSENRLIYALNLCNHLIDSSPIELFKIDRSSNWDDHEIEDITKRLLGDKLTVSQSIYSAIKQPFRDDLGALKLVKELRNRLAHGEISFEQCSEDVTVERLIDLKNRISAYLLETINVFAEYLKAFKYLVPEQRPR